MPLFIDSAATSVNKLQPVTGKKLHIVKLPEATNPSLEPVCGARGGGGGGGGGGGRGDSHMKWTGMLVVSLRGVNFGFCSRLGCSGQNVIIFSRQGLV